MVRIRASATATAAIWLMGVGAAVVIHRDTVENGRVGTAGADRRQLPGQMVHAGIHLFFKRFRRAAHGNFSFVLH